MLPSVLFLMFTVTPMATCTRELRFNTGQDTYSEKVIPCVQKILRPTLDAVGLRMAMCQCQPDGLLLTVNGPLHKYIIYTYVTHVATLVHMLTVMFVMLNFPRFEVPYDTKSNREQISVQQDGKVTRKFPMTHHQLIPNDVI